MNHLPSETLLALPGTNSTQDDCRRRPAADDISALKKFRINSLKGVLINLATEVNGTEITAQRAGRLGKKCRSSSVARVVCRATGTRSRVQCTI